MTILHRPGSMMQHPSDVVLDFATCIMPCHPLHAGPFADCVLQQSRLLSMLHSAKSTDAGYSWTGILPALKMAYLAASQTSAACRGPRHGRRARQEAILQERGESCEASALALLEAGDGQHSGTRLYV